MTASKSAPQQAADARVEAAAEAIHRTLPVSGPSAWVERAAKAALAAADRAADSEIRRLQARIASQTQEITTLEAEILAGRRAFAAMQERIAELEAAAETRYRIGADHDR